MNGILKNFSVIGDEFRHWWYAMKKEHLPRFKEASLRSGKNNVVHLLVNLLTETVRAMPRTVTYSLLFYAGYQITGALL